MLDAGMDPMGASDMGAPAPEAAPEMGMAPQPMRVHDVTISRTKKYGCAKVENIPPEEFGVTRRQRSVLLRDCDYCYHEVKRTVAQLIQDGYDEKQVMDLPSHSAGEGGTEETARDTVAESDTEGDEINKVNRQITVTEHYILMDYEGNGKPKHYRVTTAGGENDILKKKDGSLAIEPDYVRFAAMTPYIMTHRFFGRSVADMVMDIQKIKTFIKRSILDNLALANNQRTEIAETHATKDTLDDLLSNRPGGIVRTKQPGGLMQLGHVSIGDVAYPLMEYVDGEREWRTGVTKQGQGLDPNALKNVGEKAILDSANAARARTKLIARIFAETGVKELFWLLHRTVRENATEADTVKLGGGKYKNVMEDEIDPNTGQPVMEPEMDPQTGQPMMDEQGQPKMSNRPKQKQKYPGGWVPIDPTEWRERDDIVVKVGLGNSSNEQELAFLLQLLGYQQMFMADPNMKGSVGPDQIYATMKQVVRRGGLKSVDPYMEDPKTLPEPEPQPTPEEQKVQAQIQADQQKAQSDAQLQQQKLQGDSQMQQQKLMAEAEAQRQKQAGEMALNQQELQQEMMLKREQIAMELQLKRESLQAELALKRELGHASIAAGGKQNGGTSGVHVGGDPG